MSKYQTPCRYDFVGSFLRPQEVKQAKADYAEGKISEEAVSYTHLTLPTTSRV